MLLIKKNKISFKTSSISYFSFYLKKKRLFVSKTTTLNTRDIKGVLNCSSATFKKKQFYQIFVYENFKKVNFCCFSLKINILNNRSKPNIPFE